MRVPRRAHRARLVTLPGFVAPGAFPCATVKDAKSSVSVYVRLCKPTQHSTVRNYMRTYDHILVKPDL